MNNFRTWKVEPLTSAQFDLPITDKYIMASPNNITKAVISCRLKGSAQCIEQLTVCLTDMSVLRDRMFLIRLLRFVGDQLVVGDSGFYTKLYLHMFVALVSSFPQRDNSLTCGTCVKK